MPKCLICKTDYLPFISFGEMPIANGFLTSTQFENEYFFSLQVGHCPNCHMVQLVEQPDREMMFHDDYAFFSSTSKRQEIHFKEFAKSVADKYLSSDDPFVIELGSNDGIMLQNFASAGIRHLGIEPSKNVAKVAIEKGVNTISEFFDEKLADIIIEENGKADAILAANVMCHIPYLHSVAAGFKKLLKPDGIIIYEDPYLGDIVEKTSYDQIYDEHVFYFSVASVSNLFEQHDLEVVDVAHQDVHGGSMRYIIAHKGEKEISESVNIQRIKENELGLHLPDTYKNLAKGIESSRTQLLELLTDIRKQGKRIVGYAATSKSTTVTNYCSIGPELIEFISDTTPIKQGKYSPGTHIPVKSHKVFKSNYPEYALLFGWNHAKEIMENEKEFMESGGKWVVYVPEVKII
ncbi:class I SAM-dependent methyltransferase [bacterium]|nr:class I SAM-dependent methyltransferase [bacterium]